jgi:prefoldin subunit 5
MTDTQTTEPRDADAIVADASVALDAIDANIASLRATRAQIGAKVQELLEQRKPLARIVSAAQPRTRKSKASSPNGDTE